jgi:uncharacterized protein YndB with AHSA1/START domain
MRKRLVLEYTLNSSPKVLFPRLSTPGGLSEWFADDVNLKGNIYYFIWEGIEQKAELVQKKENRFIRFKWMDEEEDSFFEFRINVDELTGDVALVIVDMVEEEDEKDEIVLWDSQIAELKHVLGS